MTISQRALVHDVLVDVVCTGRFYDFFEKRDGALGDRAAPADLREGPHGPGRSGRAARLDAGLLQRFPEGYRHLAYLQTEIGYQVKPDMPGLKGPEVEALYARGRTWPQHRSPRRHRVGLIYEQLRCRPPKLSRRVAWLPHAFDWIMSKAVTESMDNRDDSCSEFIR